MYFTLHILYIFVRVRTVVDGVWEGVGRPLSAKNGEIYETSIFPPLKSPLLDSSVVDFWTHVLKFSGSSLTESNIFKLSKLFIISF